MKNKWTMLAGVAVAFMGLNWTVQAVPISGTVTFNGGTVQYTDTTIESFGGSTFVGGGTGSYLGTGGTGVNWYGGVITFSPTLSPNPVSPYLWEFMSGGKDYSFVLTGITAAYGDTAGLSISGFGTLSISGYNATPGTFTLLTTAVQVPDALTQNGIGSDYTLSFNAMSAVSSAVPDGGTTVLLLGLALVAIGLFPRKMAA